MYLFDSGEEKMMMQGDFDLIPVQRYTDSVKQVLKQTMLNQDVLFRNQVHELHRLYRLQESLMKDFGLQEYNYNSWNPKPQTSLLPLRNPTRHESPAKQARISLTSKVGSTSFIDQKLLKDCQGRKPLNLLLSADEFINLVEEDLPKKGTAQNCFEGPIDFKLPLSEGSSSYAEDLKLSLVLGGDNRRMAGTMRTCFIKKTFYCSQNVIDLEESDERMSDGYAKCEIVSEEKHEFQGSAFPDPTILKKDLSHEMVESSSVQEYSECYQEQTSSTAGIMGSLNDPPSDDLLFKMQPFTSYQGWQLDLNKAHPDDSSCCSYDLAYPPSRASSEGGSDGFTGGMKDRSCPTMFQKKDIVQSSNEACDMHKQDNRVNLTHMDLNRKNNMSRDIWTRNSKDCEINRSEPCLVSPESMVRPPVIISEDLGCCTGNDKHDIVELKSKLSSEVSSDKSGVESAVLSCTDQNQNTFQDEQGKSPASCKSCCISDNDSSNAKTANSGIVKQYMETRLESQVADVLMDEHEQRTSDNSNLKSDCYNNEGKVDVLIQEAAELLLHISSGRSACNQEMENERKVQPLCSFDSFELNAINLTESNVDDDYVSSKPFEITDMEAKEFGLRLRRGRRMKDFQREILPSLTSLSRHEILEDINIMEGVLRSREYRKMRAKMAVHGDNWAAPIRSRRPGLSYAGRRKFS